MTRREFLRQLALICLLATPIGKYVYGLYLKSKEIPTIEFRMATTPIVVNPRKLKAVWTTEYAQDMRVYHSQDVEDELISAITSEIRIERDNWDGNWISFNRAHGLKSVRRTTFAAWDRKMRMAA